MFGTDYKYVDENAVRLDLDDLGGEIVSILFIHLDQDQLQCYSVAQARCLSLLSQVSSGLGLWWRY